MSDQAKPTSQQQPARQQVKVEVPADLTAQYVNFALITQTMSEVMLDFAQVLPSTPKARVQTRLILTPTNAKLLHKALGDSLARFEALHGEIKVPPTLADRLFRSVRPEGDDESSDGAPPTDQGDIA